MAEKEYPFGSANTTPHIHQYGNGCHLKVAGGDRYDLIKGNAKVKQYMLNQAFDRVRSDYPNNHDTGTLLIQTMKRILQNVPADPSERARP